MTDSMFPHHQETIDRLIEASLDTPGLEAILVCGSIAHGFATEASDVDVMFVLTGEEHARLLAQGIRTFYNPDVATYDGGYVDGKYISRAFLDDVERHGSEPARFAFDGARVVYGDTSLHDQLARIVAYPRDGKQDRIERFYAQLTGWRWFAREATKRNDPYLMGAATSRMLLFAGRLILARNEILYPFHKWLFRVLDDAPDKPAGIMDLMRTVAAHPSVEDAERLYAMVEEMGPWVSGPFRWTDLFVQDSEQRWLDDTSAVDDL